MMFATIVSIINVHEESIFEYEGFDEVAEFFKRTLPQICSNHISEIQSKCIEILDKISQDLDYFAIEYSIYQEENHQNGYENDGNNLTKAARAQQNQPSETTDIVAQKVENLEKIVEDLKKQLAQRDKEIVVLRQKLSLSKH